MITSTQNNRIKQFALLKTKRGREASKQFLVEGEHLIQAAIAAGVLDVLVYSGPNDYAQGNWESIEVNRTVLERLSNVTTPSNYIGICHMETSLAPIAPPRIVALCDVQDPGNGGTIARSALAFNFPLLWLSEGSFDWYNDKTISRNALISLCRWCRQKKMAIKSSLLTPIHPSLIYSIIGPIKSLFL
jgi:TrmH family RNA methyltransferase